MRGWFDLELAVMSTLMGVVAAFFILAKLGFFGVAAG